MRVSEGRMQSPIYTVKPDIPVILIRESVLVVKRRPRV